MMLDEELRRYLAEVQERVKKDFSAFEQASGQEQAMALADFTASSNSLKVEMGNIEKELTTLKETAYNNVSEKLDIFENDFSLNLVKRSDEIDKKLNEWRQYLDNQLKTLTEDAESKWKVIEASYMEQFSAKLVESNDNWLVELEKLKSEAGDFEENIRVQMKIADDSLVSLKEQFTQGMEDARSSAEASLKAEIGRHNLTLSDTLKQSQRDMGAKLKHLQDDAETRNNELISLFETSRHSIDEWKAGFNNQLRDMETALEETRKRSKDLVAESNERLSSVRASLEDVRTEADAHRAELFSRIDEQARSMDAAIKDAERHIKDFAHQTSLFERADILKVELEHYIEDLHSDLDKIDQHKTESTNLENQFIRIKRLEDEVNAKMTRFLSEKHRIEQMETEFNRLLQTSKAVDEKLAQLSASDDTLQAMQVQIRKFNDALDTSEEKFKRIERKNQTLDATNEGIDRNFKTLQESEQTVQRIGGELTHLSNEVGVLRTNIGYMAKESEKAKSVADKVSTLDTTLSEIDQRIATVQASREWLARLETRLEELNKQAQDQVKLIGSLMKDNSVPLKGNKGAPPIGTRENVIKLSQQGWTVDEIARAQKLGRGEVELILELAHNG
jgi:chromosome segregation ATPase